MLIRYIIILMHSLFLKCFYKVDYIIIMSSKQLEDRYNLTINILTIIQQPCISQ